MREVDGKKIAFVTHDVYFAGAYTPSMYSTARDTGADVVLLLGPNKTGDDLTDDEIRELLAISGHHAESGHD